ncbi:MSMEG_1061 family FMN-dependent PPOX-type flavoprotein [Mariniluteicoccus flavus]
MRITTLDQLREHYPNEPSPVSLAKETDHVTPLYADLIAASPFCVVSTVGDRGINCSPRGDGPGFVRVRDPRTLELADRRGNNRLDGLRDLIADPRIGLIFLVPDVGECVRVRGTAQIRVEDDLLESHAVKGKAPASVLVIDVEKVFFQCSRAILRSKLWDPDSRVDRGSLPTPGMLAEEQGGFTADERSAYDAGLAERQAQTLY